MKAAKQIGKKDRKLRKLTEKKKKKNIEPTILEKVGIRVVVLVLRSRYFSLQRTVKR